MIDGGFSQVNAAKKIILENKLNIAVVGIAKGPQRKKNEVINPGKVKINKKIIIEVRDEAHRFALSYHRLLRHKNFFNSN